MDARYCVCILTNRRHTVLYTGVTKDLARRFTNRYNVNKLVFYEEHPDPLSAIAREGQIKPARARTRLA